MAISTPAQKPRGSANRTRSTGMVSYGTATTLVPMSHPQVVAVAPASPAALAGLVPGDEILSINGQRPRDVIQYRLLVDEADVELEVRRGGLELSVPVSKTAGSPLGAEVQSA